MPLKLIDDVGIFKEKEPVSRFGLIDDAGVFITEPTYLDILKSVPARLKGMVIEQIGGTRVAFEESDMGKKLKELEDEIYKDFPEWVKPQDRNETIKAGLKLAEKGRQIRESAMPATEKGSLKHTVNLAAEVVPHNLALILAAVLTRQPNIALTGMGLSKFGGKYLEYREAGRTPRVAFLGAGASATAEAATEKLPLGQLMKVGKGFLSRLLNYGVVEIPQEWAMDIIDNALDKVLVDPDRSFTDLWDDLVETTKVTALTIPFIAGGSHIAVRALEKPLRNKLESKTQENIKAGMTEDVAQAKALLDIAKTEEGKEAFRQIEDATVDKIQDIIGQENQVYEEFLKAPEVEEVKPKPTELELPLGAEKTALEGKIPTVELPETPLERATREAEARRVEAEMAERQVGIPEVKEAWQMTREEYFKKSMTETGIDADIARIKTERMTPAGTIDRATFNTLELIAKANHKDKVRQALSEGKPVSEEVLKDYPDLVRPEVKEPPAVPAELEPLAEEARKYKSADEFEKELRKIRLGDRVRWEREFQPFIDKVIEQFGDYKSFYIQATKGIKEVKPKVKEIKRVERPPYNFVLYSNGEIAISSEGRFIHEPSPELLEEAKKALEMPEAKPPVPEVKPEILPTISLATLIKEGRKEITPEELRQLPDVVSGRYTVEDMRAYLETKGIRVTEVAPVKEIKEVKPKAPAPTNIITWIKSKGGIDYLKEEWGGEIDIAMENQPTLKAAVNKKGGGLTLDELSQMAYTEGWIREATPQALLNAIEKKQLLPEIAEKRTIKEMMEARLKEKAELRKAKAEAGYVEIPVKQEKYFELSDKTIEERIEEAKKGITPEGILKATIENAKEALHGFTRVWKTLPRDTFHANAEFEFIAQQDYRRLGAEEANKKLSAILADYNKADADLFTKAMLVDDAIETVAIAKELKEKVKLGFGFTEENLDTFKKEIDTQLEAHPEVRKDLDLFREMHRDLTNQFIDTYGKLDKSYANWLRKRLSREQYYHHMIMAYAQKDLNKYKGVTSGKGLKIRRWRGFLTKRYGSLKDYNANVVQAMYKVWAQMETDIRLIESYKRIKDQYDISPQLKTKLKNIRQTVMKGLIWRGDFIDQSIGSNISENIKRLWEISKEKAEMFESGDISDAQMIRYENEIIRLTKEIQDNINLYRGKFIDPAFVSAETEKLQQWYEEKMVNKLKGELKEQVEEGMLSLEDIFGEIEAPALDFMARPFTSFQMALLNGEIVHTAKFLIPEVYSPVKVRDVFYYANTIGEDLARDITEKYLETVISPDEIKKVLAKGDPEVWVIPETIKDTIEHIAKQKTREVSPLRETLEDITTFIKRYFLFAPHKFLKYVTNNTVGDYTFFFGIAPKAVISDYQKESFDIMQALWKKKMPELSEQRTKDVKQFFEFGGSSVGFTAYEMEWIIKAPQFAGFDKRGFLNKIASLPKAYFDKVVEINTFTETHRRLAGYLYFLDELRAGRMTHASSKAEIIDGLSTIEQQAFQLANDMLVHYGAVSETGRSLGRIPLVFWSFREGNFKRFANAIRNAPMDATTAQKITKSILGPGIAVTTATAIRIATLWLRVSALLAITSAFNWLFFPDEEEELPEDVKMRPHLTLGRDKEGNIIYWHTFDSLNELLRWVGLDRPKRLIDEILRGNFKNVAMDIAMAPIDEFYGLLNPSFKIPMEMLARKSFWPSIQEPKPIRDRMEYFMKIWGLDPEYKALAGKPQETYLLQRARDLFFRKIAPNETAYWDIKRLRKQFAEEKGYTYIETTGGKLPNALWEWRRAIKLGDKKAHDKYLKEAVKIAAEQGKEDIGRIFTQSLLAMDPLYGLSEEQKTEFIEYLLPEERKKINKAYKYWSDVLLGNKKFE